MNQADVYFARFDSKEDTKYERMNQLLQAVQIKEFLKPRDIVALKVHVGEKGCSTRMDPKLIAEAVKIVKSCQALPFLTDTAVLYRSRRSNAVEHCLLATEHGFNVDGVGAPFIPSDGLLGTHEIMVPIDGKYYREVPIAAGALETTSIIVFSHVTGHLASGMGATLKNIGMGYSSRKGKLSQHSNMKPAIKKSKCTDCEECIEWCPEGAISNPDGIAVIDKKLCIGCGQCLAVCRFDAVAFNWGVRSLELQERMVEHACGLVKKKKNQLLFINLLLQVTKDCDCLGDAGKPVIPDYGALASTDPVAIDQAALDIIKQETGSRLGDFAYPSIQEDHQIIYAEKLGLGTRHYNLIQV
ncbi:DUF362 domain-containing protein [candidate division CSSED10-310 bacterium]|uniref:DUF362 domain-containing protein n=1 Tax=candidate division CSSED10-310 bacterium TaxID=2855610 RepID=A0ABV6YUQ9_UNCC1